MNTSTYGISKLLVLVGIIAMGACAEHTREYSTDLQHFEPQVRFTADLDMYESPSLEIYQETDLFANGLTSQKPVAGTIPRGFMPYPYANDTAGYRLAGLEWKNPLESTPEVLAKGKDLYTKFCMHCHGEGGDADGSVILNSKFPPPPSFLTGNSSKGGTLLELPEGRMFHIITYGQNMMGSHASQVNHDERWHIISYIKSLQAASISSGEGEEAGEEEESTSVATLPVVAEEPEETESTDATEEDDNTE